MLGFMLTHRYLVDVAILGLEGQHGLQQELQQEDFDSKSKAVQKAVEEARCQIKIREDSAGMNSLRPR